MLINSPNISGSLNVSGNTVITGSLTTSIAALNTPATTFLTSNNGTIRSRTAAQTLSDIGAQATGSYLTVSNASNLYVPYTGATASVNLGYNSLAASNINIDGNAPTAGSYLGFKQATTVNTGVGGYTSISTFGTNKMTFSFAQPTGYKSISFTVSEITQDVSGGRVYTMPDSSGTLALTSNLGAYLPLTGGTITGSLTVTGDVIAQTLNVQEVTSSIVYSSGSNIFGNDVSNTQQFTGSVNITGSLTTSIAPLGSAATTFLTSNGGTIRSRTAAQTLSDIGGQATGSYVTVSTNQSITGQKTFTKNIDVNGVYVGRGASSGDLFGGISGNTAIGNQALLSISTGYPNTAVGAEALRNITTGANNIAIGSTAGKLISAGTANETSTTSIYIGNDTRPSANGNTNEIVIGHTTIGNGSNTVTIGNSSITNTYLKGAVTLTGALNGTSAVFSSSVSIGGADQGYQLDVKRTSTGDSTFDTVANFYKASTHNTGLLLRLKNTIVDLAANNITGGGGPTAGMSFSVSSGGTISTALTLASTGAATFSSTLACSGAFIQLNQTEFIASTGASNRAYAIALGNTAAGDFVIMQGSSATGGTYTPRLAISPTGNVGIGTASPAAGYLLDVYGTATFGASTTTGDKIHIGSGAVPAGAAGIGLWATGSNLFSIVGFGDTTIDSRGSYLIINPNGGNVGIGTTTPAAKLYVGASVNNVSADVSTIAQLIAPRATTAYPLTLSSSGSGVTNDQIRMTFNYGQSFSATAYIASRLENASLAETGLVFGVYKDGSGLIEAMRITSARNVSITDGNLVIGTAGKGIDFSATSNGSGTTSSELLNDYEEGTWAPIPTSTGATFNTSVNGTYTKIGRLVFITCQLDNASAPTGTLTNEMSITNLPFTASPGMGYGASLAIGFEVGIDYPTGGLGIQARIISNTTIISLRFTKDDASGDDFLASNFDGSDARIALAGCYEV